MESDDDVLSFSDTDKPSSPVPERKLKRLKKATVNEVLQVSLTDSFFDAAPPVQGLNLFEGGDFEDPDARSGSDRLEEGSGSDPGFDGLGVEGEGGSGAKRALDFDGSDKESEDLVRTEKKRSDLDGSEANEEKKKKKKKRLNNGDNGCDEISDFSASNKRRENKERRDRLKELRAESQRLLRETRDAAFKPVPIVQTSVSSVLEKIRQRKLEVSKKLVVTNGNNGFRDGTDAYTSQVKFDFETFASKDVGNNEAAEADSEEIIVGPNHMERSEDTLSSEEFKGTAKLSHEDELDDKRNETFRAPVDDTQDLIFDSQPSNFKDELPDETPSSPMEEVLAPSLLAMNLKLDSVPLDDLSSDEEDNDKENIDPLSQGSADSTLSPKGDPVKAFVDEEAEEEDDSDNDLGRFPDNEEEEDYIDFEELNEMIATEYDEKPIDNEMRNQLHQKWLEKQDAVGTENLLQKLKCGSGLREINLFDEKEDEEAEEDVGAEDEEFLDKASDYMHSKNVMRMNLKKAKEMIPLMFTDKDDAYLSSDDEETDNRLVKQRFSIKAEGHATFLSPAEDKESKDIFGLIKKLNGVPETRKKAKLTSSFHMLSIRGKTAMSSKSSFLGRGGSKNSLPSFQKHGTATVRPFVFERDDSNSRSSIPMSQDSADLSENRPRKTASAKFTSSSQIRFNSQTTQTSEETKSGPSLHEILRYSSRQSSHCNGDNMVGQVEAIYAAFRLDQNMMKKEPKSVRTI